MIDKKDPRPTVGGIRRAGANAATSDGRTVVTAKDVPVTPGQVLTIELPGDSKNGPTRVLDGERVIVSTRDSKP